MTSPYAKAMAHAVIDDDEVALQQLLDCVMEEGYNRQPKTYWFYLLRHTGIGPSIYLHIPPDIDVVDLDWLVKATTLYEVVMMCSSYHMIRPLETVQFLPEFIHISEVNARLDNVATSILREYLRVHGEDEYYILRTNVIKEELKKRSKNANRNG